MKDASDADWQAIDAEIFAGHKIKAMKLHRVATGSELRDAKDAIDARETELRTSSPDRFTAVVKSGCLSMIFLIAGLMATIQIVWSVHR